MIPRRSHRNLSIPSTWRFGGGILLRFCYLTMRRPGLWQLLSFPATLSASATMGLLRVHVV